MALAAAPCYLRGEFHSMSRAVVSTKGTAPGLHTLSGLLCMARVWKHQAGGATPSGACVTQALREGLGVASVHELRMWT